MSKYADIYYIKLCVKAQHNLKFYYLKHFVMQTIFTGGNIF